MLVEALAPADGLHLQGAPSGLSGPSCNGYFMKTGELHKRAVYRQVQEDAGLGTSSLTAACQIGLSAFARGICMTLEGVQRCSLFYKTSENSWVLALGRRNDRPPGGAVAQLKLALARNLKLSQRCHFNQNIRSFSKHSPAGTAQKLPLPSQKSSSQVGPKMYPDVVLGRSSFSNDSDNVPLAAGWQWSADNKSHGQVRGQLVES